MTKREIINIVKIALSEIIDEKMDDLCTYVLQNIVQKNSNNVEENIQPIQKQKIKISQLPIKKNLINNNIADKSNKIYSKDPLLNSILYETANNMTSEDFKKMERGEFISSGTLPSAIDMATNNNNINPVVRNNILKDYSGIMKQINEGKSKL